MITQVAWIGCHYNLYVHHSPNHSKRTTPSNDSSSHHNTIYLALSLHHLCPSNFILQLKSSMKLHTTTLPCLFSLLCRRSLLQQCRVCSFQTYAPNPPGNTTYNTTYNTTPTRPARESGFKGAYAPRTLADREQQRFAQDEVNKYIYKLEAGELFDGDK